MGLIFNPKYLNLPQQVGQNKADIERLKNQIFVTYKTDETLTADATGVSVNTTDYEEGEGIENALLIDAHGLIFKIEGISEDETTFFLSYYSDLQGPKGEQGNPGQAGQTGETGATPNINVSANTLPAGSSATAVRSGTDENPTITFGIPAGPMGPRGLRGEKGLTGDTGPQGIPGEKGEDGNSFVVTASVNDVSDLPSASTTPEGTAYFVGTTPPRNVYVVVEYQGTKIWQNQGHLQGPPGIQGIQGVPGEDGNDGLGFTYLGNWISGEDYLLNDVVTYSSNGVVSSYILVSNSLSGSTTPPPNDNLNWQLFCQGVKGDQGNAGQPGQPGQTGQTGATPNISVVANTLPAGSSATAVRSGTDENPTITFGIPRGLTGDTGPQGPAGEPTTIDISSYPVTLAIKKTSEATANTNSSGEFNNTIYTHKLTLSGTDRSNLYTILNTLVPAGKTFVLEGKYNNGSVDLPCVLIGYKSKDKILENLYLNISGKGMTSYSGYSQINMAIEVGVAFAFSGQTITIYYTPNTYAGANYVIDTLKVY